MYINRTLEKTLNAPKTFNFLEKLNQPIGSGMVICLSDKDYPLSKEVDAVPVTYL